ncbi:MAG: methyl-accepting chemotaxis protein [Usitatibacteraceae bacterium]
MKIQHRVMLSATVTICVMFTAFTYMYTNQSSAVNAAREIASTQTPAAASASLARAEEAMTSTRRILIGLTIFVLLERALAVFGLVSVLSRHVYAAMDYVRKCASGDLRGEVVTLKNNELGLVLDSINHMNEGISTLVRSVRQAALQVEQGARQLNDSSLDLSERTEEQAASLEETAASMTQFTAAIKDNLANTASVHESARTAAKLAEQGGKAITNVETTMLDIQASAKRMQDIIAIIDGIAFQTNILALNAAVEAARAGEQGRGFAVVASEVRTLAQRSSQSAKEIRALIAESVERVDTGVASVTEASESMGKMMASVGNISDLIAGVATRANEQNSSVTQINHALVGLERVTSQNATLVQKTSAIADDLTREAQSLIEEVSRFKLKDDVAIAVPARVASPRRIGRA